MIKAEVVFDEDWIKLGDYELREGKNNMWHIYKNESHIDYFDTLEDAIKYCLEN